MKLKIKQQNYLLLGIVLAILIIWLWPPASIMVPDCELDGNFGDWRGRSGIDDMTGDGRSGVDFKRVDWALNVNDPRLYFKIERYRPKNPETPLECRMFIDINGNGRYTDKIDKFADIVYQPRNQLRGDVSVQLYNMSGKVVGKYSGAWGDGIQQGGRRFEFALSTEELQVLPAQPLHLYISDVSGRFDNMPDSSDIQWSPFPLVHKSKAAISILTIFWLLSTAFLYRHRIWALHYVWGSVGLCFILILLIHASAVEYALESGTSLILHYVLGYCGILTYIFDQSPGTMLVLIRFDQSWTTISVDIENSGLIEMSIIFCLIVFYPVYRGLNKIWAGLLGVLGVYLINLVRLSVVIILIHEFGRNMNYIAHTVFGRLVFFVLIVALYWRLITRPSLHRTGRKIEGD